MGPATIFQAVGTGLQAAGELRRGKQVKDAKDFEAQQYDELAKAEYARGTREAYESKRETDIAVSDARAAMGASGGTTTDEGAIEGLAKIESQGQYNALAALFDAKVDQDQLRLEAESSRYEGSLAKSEGRRRALATVLSGASKMWPGFNAGSNPGGTGTGGSRLPRRRVPRRPGGGWA